jgi:uncharacterized integral membrane protein
MQIFLIFSLIIAFLAVIFAVQNNTVVPVRFLIWETEGSLALILFIALFAGALISYLATTPTQIRQRMRISNQRKEITELDDQLKNSRQELEGTREQLKQLEEQNLKETSEPADNDNSNDN